MADSTLSGSGGIGTRIREMGTRRIAFYAVVVLFIGLFGAMAAPVLTYLVTGWLPATDLGAHRTHELVIAATLFGILLGMVAQLRRPENAIGGIYQTVLIVLSVFVSGALGSYVRPEVLIFLVWAAIAAALHPAGRDVLRIRSTGQVNRILLGLVIVAAIPLLLFAANQIALQAGSADHGGATHEGDAYAEHGHEGDAHNGMSHEEIHQEHIDEGHFASVAGLIFAIVLLGVLASLSPPAWWLPAWTAGGMAIVFGLASALYPDVASSAGVFPGALAAGWGVVFVALAELTQDEKVPSALGRLFRDRATAVSAE